MGSGYWDAQGIWRGGQTGGRNPNAYSMDYGSAFGDAIPGAIGGAGAGLMVGGPVGAAIGGGIGLIGGFLGAGDDQRRAFEAQQAQAARMSQRDAMIAKIMEQAQAGSQQMLAGRTQDVERQYEQRSRATIRDAARRGLIHSGYAAAQGRDLQRERAGAMTQAEAAAQAYLIQALLGAGNLQFSGLQTDTSFDLGMAGLYNQDQASMLQALAMFGQSAGGLGSALGASGGAGAEPPQFAMVPD